MHTTICSREELQVSDRVFERNNSHLETLGENIRGSPSIGSAETTVGRTRQIPPDCYWKEKWPVSLARKSWSDLGRTALQGVKAQRNC